MAAAASLAAAIALALAVRPAQAQHPMLAGADSVRVSALPVEVSNPAGDVILIPVVLDHAVGYHTWPDEPVVPPELRGMTPIPTRIEALELPDGASIEAIEWPDPVPVRVRYLEEPLEVLSFVGLVTADVRVLLAGVEGRAEPEPGTLVLEVEYQACDEEICYPPKTVELTVQLGSR